jgi:DNA-binding Xre family transcriptional regulator
MTPRTLLSRALQAAAPSSAALAEIADRAGGLRTQIFRARKGKPVNAGAFLSLCAVIGIDPVDGSPRPVKVVPSTIAWPMVAVALRISRRLRHHDQRSAAQVIGISAATVCRVEAGNPVSIESLVAACRFIGVHPDDYATTQSFTGNGH